jgi:hypothetical protein
MYGYKIFFQWSSVDILLPKSMRSIGSRCDILYGVSIMVLSQSSTNQTCDNVKNFAYMWHTHIFQRSPNNVLLGTKLWYERGFTLEPLMCDIHDINKNTKYCFLIKLQSIAHIQSIPQAHTHINVRVNKLPWETWQTPFTSQLWGGT